MAISFLTLTSGGMTGTLAARGPTGGGGLPLVPAPPTDRVTHPPAASVAAPPLVDPASVIAPTLGPTELEAAQASLSRGEGPAGGAPFACAPSTTVPSMTDCGRSAPSSPPAVHPASAFNPTNGLGWAIQGVPQSRGYINYALTWDPIDGYVLLFGGSNATGDYMGDTWSFQNGAWTELFPLTTPLGRDSSGLVYDPSDSSMMLFGGYTPAASAALNDTWLFRGGTWTEVPTGTGPLPRYGFGLVWDPATYTDILFGGYSPLCPTATANLCNDTWSWSDGTWTELHPTGAPPARYRALDDLRRHRRVSPHVRGVRRLDVPAAGAGTARIPGVSQRGAGPRLRPAAPCAGTTRRGIARPSWPPVPGRKRRWASTARMAMPCCLEARTSPWAACRTRGDTSGGPGPNSPPPTPPTVDTERA